MNYTDLTMDELAVKRVEIQEQIAALNADLTLVAAAYDSKAYDIEIARKFGNLSADEITALQKLIPVTQTVSGVTGIPSNAAAGQPGA